jgi:phage gpG-like protein
MQAIFGYDQLTRYMSRLSNQLGSRLKDGLQDAALIVEKAAKENILHGRADWPAIKLISLLHRKKISQTQPTPLLDTGTMLRSIHSEVEESQAIIGSGLKYAPPHEFGCDIKVTPKMRIFLHFIGIHLKTSTSKIHIPARPYLTPAVQENMRGIKEVFIKRLRGH